MSDEDQESRRIGSVETSLRLIEKLQELNRTTVSTLSNELDLSPGTVHPHLATLRERDYVVQEEDQYRLGPNFLTLGDHVRNQYDLYWAGRDVVDELAAETDECAHLIIERSGKEFSVYESFGENAAGVEIFIRNRETPRRIPHCTAAGKAILAHKPTGAVERIVDRGLERRTPNTITDAEIFRVELDRVRERGFALNDEEEIPGVRAVGAPILDEEQSPRGAVTLSAPASRLEGERFRERTGERLIEASNLIEIQLQSVDEPA